MLHIGGGKVSGKEMLNERLSEDAGREGEKRSVSKEEVVATINGVDVDQLVSTVGAIQENPALAEFRFRARTEWVEGGHSRTKIQSFYGAGDEDASRTEPFYLEGDEPPMLLGSNAGPNAVETVLHALSSCLAVGFVYNAAAEGITVESLNFEVEGEVDLHGFLGLSDDVRPGYKNIALTYRVECDAPREKVVQICEHVQKTSPVLDIIRNPVPVSVKLAEEVAKA